MQAQVHATTRKLSKDEKLCIPDCMECHRTCLEAVQYCLQKGGALAAPEHIKLLLDCADMCATTANFMLRASEMEDAVCHACALVCQRCAESCESFDDPRMKACAKVCRACEGPCKRMGAECC